MATIRQRFTGPELRILQDMRVLRESNGDYSYVYSTYTDLFSKERLSRSTPAKYLLQIIEEP